MTNVYPIILTRYSDGYLVSIPDFDINTEGSDLAEAIFMARDAIGLMSIQYQDMGKPLPEAFSRSFSLGENDTQTLVDVDLDEYRRKHDNKMVKKNCTIPYYLNVEAERRGLNFSRVLQEALLEKIGN